MKVNIPPALPQRKEIETLSFPYHSTNVSKQEEELIQKINKLREKGLRRDEESQEIDQLIERVEKGLEETEQLVKKIRQNGEEGLKRRESMLQSVQLVQQQVEENTAFIDRIEKQTQEMIQVDQMQHIQEEMEQILTPLEQNPPKKQDMQFNQEIDNEAHTWSIFTCASSFFDQKIAHYASVATMIRTQSFFWMTIKLIENPTGWITAHAWSLVADTTTHPVTWVAVGIVCYVFPVARLAVGGVAFYTLTHYASLKSRRLEEEVE